jgi:ElaB/YqjD/DUF883 family membrane-anchored ribosome-binding protein
MTQYYQILVKPISGSSILLRLTEEELERWEAIIVARLGPLLPTCRVVNACGRSLTEEDLRQGSGSHPCMVFIRGLLLGGKGGFGANLRRQGGRMRVKKTTNFDACRDLSGRRIKTVKDIQRMTDHITSSDQRKSEEADQLRRKIIDGLQGPSKRVHHIDANFVKELKDMVEATAESVEVGVATARNNSQHQQKNEAKKQQTAMIHHNKRLSLWEDGDGFVDEEEEDLKKTVEPVSIPVGSSVSSY